jgi:hypothetical protein
VELATIADGFGGTALAFARPALVDGLQASGRVDEAIVLVDSSVAEARDLGNPFWLAYALWIAGITLSKVDPPRALSAWDEGLAVVHEHRVDFFRGFLARDAARLHTTAGEADAALVEFDVAIDSFHRSGNVAQLTITLASMPELLVRLGELTTAATLHAAMMKIPASVDHVPELVALGERLSPQLGAAATTNAAAGLATIAGQQPSRRALPQGTRGAAPRRRRSDDPRDRRTAVHLGQDRRSPHPEHLHQDRDLDPSDGNALGAGQRPICRRVFSGIDQLPLTDGG